MSTSWRSAVQAALDAEVRPEPPVYNLLARIVAVAEALDCGDVEEARQVIFDIEAELEVGAYPPPVACGTCGSEFMWPGLLERHMNVSTCGLTDEAWAAAA